MIELDKDAMPQKTNSDYLNEASNDEKVLILSELLHKFFSVYSGLSFGMFIMNWLTAPYEEESK